MISLQSFTEWYEQAECAHDVPFCHSGVELAYSLLLSTSKLYPVT